eukprot:5926364-Prorocentrum_lima.AAC.1
MSKSPNQCLHTGQEGTGSDYTHQTITCRNCQKTLFILWKRVDSRLVDKCLEDARRHGIYMPPMTDHQWLQLQDQRMDIEMELIFGQDAGL